LRVSSPGPADGGAYVEAVAVGLRDALLCGMTAVDPCRGHWSYDWQPRTTGAAFVGVVEEAGIEGDDVSLVVLFRTGPHWSCLYGWRARLWADGVERDHVMATRPDTDRLVGDLALEVMAGIDGRGWVLPPCETAEPVWRPGAADRVTWVTAE